MEADHQNKEGGGEGEEEDEQEEEEEETVRNVAIVAPVDNGKTTLTAFLVGAASRVTPEPPAEPALADAPRRGATRLRFDRRHGKAHQAPYGQFQINLIDTPRNWLDPSVGPGVLSGADGALVVLDCIEGYAFYPLRWTLHRALVVEGLKPLLVINKIDRAILELQWDPEELYGQLRRLIDSVNAHIATELGHDRVQIEPGQGTVAFISARDGWGFTLNTFATMYGNKLNVPAEQMLSRFWGDQFYDPESRRWYSPMSSPGTNVSATGKPLQRGFCQFVLRPIYGLIHNAMGGPDGREKLQKMMAQLGEELSPAERELGSYDIMKCAMGKFLPLTPALLEIMTHQLPPPRHEDEGGEVEK